MSIRIVGQHVGHWGALCALILAGLALSGCRTGSQQQFAELPGDLAGAPPASPEVAPAVALEPTTAATPVASPPVAGPELEVFRAGDSLTIVYADLPVITPGFEGRIKEDGTITLLLNQSFNAAGKTAGGLEQEIRARYVPKYYKNMTVTVTPRESTRWYYVDGEVRAPNRQIYNSRITVLQAIASSGGFTDFAKKSKVRLTRVDGRTMTIDCTKALENPKLDLEVYPGDKIHVPRRLW
ncbi:MAG TPA: SLBB domain-containing protein [Candidatus Paceibacterota bacterium]|nr:SLBB domain-containing protein [Verrucomicrobiota bacterium]HSA12869.1 SLBB domain-containing protein [Candidatus Paceibacterota bacterium]